MEKSDIARFGTRFFTLKVCHRSNLFTQLLDVKIVDQRVKSLIVSSIAMFDNTHVVNEIKLFKLFVSFTLQIQFRIFLAIMERSYNIQLNSYCQFWGNMWTCITLPLKGLSHLSNGSRQKSFSESDQKIPPYYY